VGTLASQAEIGVWVQAPWSFHLPGSGVITAGKKIQDCVRKILQSCAFWPEKWSQCRQCALKHFNNENAFRQLFNNGSDVPTCVLRRNGHRYAIVRSRADGKYCGADGGVRGQSVNDGESVYWFTDEKPSEAYSSVRCAATNVRLPSVNSMSSAKEILNELDEKEDETNFVASSAAAADAADEVQRDSHSGTAAQVVVVGGQSNAGKQDWV